MRRRQNKFGNTRMASVDGAFDSIGEHQRWVELRLLEKAGVISGLERQVKFVLQPAFEMNGVRYREISWTPDFAYTEGGVRFVEDFKCPATAKSKDFRMKLKMFVFKYGAEYRVRMSYKKRGGIAVEDV